MLDERSFEEQMEEHMKHAKAIADMLEPIKNKINISFNGVIFNEEEDKMLIEDLKYKVASHIQGIINTRNDIQKLMRSNLDNIDLPHDPHIATIIQAIINAKQDLEDKNKEN